MVRMTAGKAHLGALATFLLALLAQATGLVEAPAAAELEAAGRELTAALVELATSAIGAGVTWVAVYLGRNRPRPAATGAPTASCGGDGTPRCDTAPGHPGPGPG